MLLRSLLRSLLFSLLRSALRSALRSSQHEHIITFKNADHVGDLSQYGGDTALKETKRLIHMQKER